MTFTEHFDVIADTTIAPQPWMQMRSVATGQSDSVSKTYDPTDGWAKNDTLQTLQVEWTNTSPLDQMVYGMVTKSGAQVTLQCRSRGYISTGHAIHVGTGTPSLSVIEVSRFGVGSDLGNGGILNIGGAFGVSEFRQNSTSVPLMPHITQWYVVAPGATVTARVEVKFLSERWENTLIDGGDGDTEAKIITGDLRLDLFAIPQILPAAPRVTPTVVGAAADNSRNLIFWDTHLNPSVPAGVQAGDTLLALVCNQFANAADISPVQPGWQTLHVRDGGFLNSHMKVYIRTAGDNEPDGYDFTNGMLAEGTAVIIAVRNAVPYDSADGSISWRVASELSKYKELSRSAALERLTGGPRDPNSPTLFTVCGTWGSTTEQLMNTPEGIADVAVGLGVDPALWNWHPIDYTGAVLSPEAMFAMDRSSAGGTEKLMAAILATPGPFALCGTSQGAIVCSNVYDALRTGQLQHRRADFVGGFMFGNPRRQVGYTIPGGLHPGGDSSSHGVMVDSLLVNCEPDLWWDFSNTGDMVSDVDDTTDGQANSAIFQFMFQNYTGQGSIGDQVWTALNSGLNVTMQTAAAITANLAEMSFMALELVLAILTQGEWPVLSPHLAYHLTYTNLPGNTKSAVQLAIDRLEEIAVDVRNGAALDETRIAWGHPIPGAPYGVRAPSAPSIEALGQLLLAVSYFPHTPLQGTIAQNPPYGMTELVDYPGPGSSLSVAYLADPPNPTKDRVFELAEYPLALAKSITAAILIPGVQGA